MRNDDQSQNFDRIIRALDAIKKDMDDVKTRIAALEKGRAPIAAQQSPPPPQQPTSTQARPEAAPPKPPATEKKSLEARIGGKWLNYIGIIAVIIGTGFFIKYAFENNWVGPTGRVVIGILVGLAFIVWGEFWKSKYKFYAQGLVGCGIAILFLALFGAAGYYNIIPMNIGRILFFLITIFAVFLSVRYSSSVIALMGFLGGYLNPILLSTGENREAALLSYVIMLDLGILAVAYFKNWKWLQAVALAATVVIFAGWADKFYSIQPIPYKMTELFLVLFFLIFTFISVFSGVIHRKKTDLFDLIFILVTATVFFATSYANLKDFYPDWMGLFSGIMALFYFILAFSAYKRTAADTGLILTFLAVALSFLVIMVPIELEKGWITIGWAVLASALIWIGLRIESRTILLGGAGLLIVAVGKLFFSDLQMDIYQPGFMAFFNERFLSALVTAASVFVSAYFISKKTDAGYSRPGGITLFVLGHLIIIVAISLEISDYFSVVLWHLSAGIPPTIDTNQFQDLYNSYLYAQKLSLSVIWALYSVALMIIGFVKRHAPSRIFAIALFFVTILKVFFYDLSELANIYRIISFIALGIALLGVSFLYTRYKDQIIGVVIGDGKENGHEDL
jgi:uncharacterized membrane protein